MQACSHLLCLVSICQDLHALALACDDVHSLWWRLNLHASLHKFYKIWSPNASELKFCCLLIQILSCSARDIIMPFWQLAFILCCMYHIFYIKVALSCMAFMFFNIVWFHKKYVYPPHGRSLEIPKGRGSQQPKFLRESMKLDWKLLGRERVQKKKPSMGEVWLLSRTTHSPQGCSPLFKYHHHHHHHYLRVRLATQCRSVCKFTLWL